jgi:hypothetical protein
VKRELGDQRSVATNLHFLGDLCVHEGDHESARSFVEESLTIRQAIPDRLGVTASLELLAAVATAQGRAERAARLFGAAEALRETIGAPLPPAELAVYGRRREILLAALGETGFAAAWNEGRALPMEQAAGLALQGRSS